MSTFYLDYEGGNNANSGADFTNRWKDLTSGATAARIAPGDTIRVMGSPAPTSLGVNGTFTNKSATVTLASALNVLIDNCDTAWTQSANVTSTADATIYRTSTKSAKHAIATGFTTGLAAFFATGTLNLSAYQGVTFWIRVDTIIAAGSLSLRLCTDTVGLVTATNGTIVVPTAATAAVNGWYPVYVDTGSNLDASIKSVALYVDIDVGTGPQAVYLDNISAVKAAGNDNLNLQSLIGTNGANETWWAIRGINGVTVTLDQTPSMTPSSVTRGYYSAAGTQTVTAYKRETIKMAVVTTIHTLQDSGTVGSLITLSGGWDRTNMSTQTLETWWDGMTGQFNLINGASKNYWKFTKFNTVRGFHGITLTGTCTGIEIPDGHFNNGGGNGLAISVTSAILGTLYCCSNLVNGFGDSLNVCSCITSTITELNCLSNLTAGAVWGFMRGSYVTTINGHNNGSSGCTHSSQPKPQDNAYMRVDTANCNDNATYGYVIDAPAGGTQGNMDIRVINAANNANYGVALGGSGLSGRTTIGKLTTSGNTIAGIQADGANLNADMIVYHSSISEATKISEITLAGLTGQFGSLRFNKYLGTVDNHLSYIQGGAGLVTTETGANRHTASGIAWKLLLSATGYITSNVPLRFPLAKLIVRASQLVTVTCYMRRSSTALTAMLVCPGYQIAGVAADVTASMTAAIDTYEQLTITFTPTEDGVVVIEAQIYGAAASIIVDDMTFTQP